MHEEEQNTDEKIVLDRLMAAMDIEGEILPKEKNQKPDFLIKKDGEILGIEITELKSYEPKSAGMQRKVISILEKRIEKLYPFSFELFVLFNGNYIKKSQIEEVVDYLLKKIKTQVESYSPADKWKIEKVDCSEDNYFISSIRFILHDREKSKKDNYLKKTVQMIEVGPVNDSPLSKIKAIIETKSKKINSYLKNCNECWLVIYSNPFFEEGIFDFSQIRNEKIVSRFEKTIVFDLLKNSEYLVL